MNEYDARMATQSEILLKRTDKIISTIQEAQKYIADMNPSLAFRLWQNVEVDLVVFQKRSNEIKEEYGTPTKEN